MLDDASYQYFMEFYLFDLIPCNYVKYNHLGMLKCVSVGFNSVIKQKNLLLPSKYCISNTIYGPTQKNIYRLDIGIDLIKNLFTDCDKKGNVKMLDILNLGEKYCHKCIEIFVYQNYIKQVFNTKPINQLNSCYKIIYDTLNIDIEPFLDQFFHDPIISDAEPVNKYENINEFATKEIMNKNFKI